MRTYDKLVYITGEHIAKTIGECNRQQLENWLVAIQQETDRLLVKFDDAENLKIDNNRIYVMQAEKELIQARLA